MKTRNFLKSKRIFALTTIFTFILLLGMASNLASKVSAAEDKTNVTTKRTINVSGDGEMNISPDLAYVTFGVMTEKNTVNEAQKENSSAMNNIIASIKKEGIQKEDIKTTNYNINPKYNYDNKTGTSTLVGYTVSSSLNVTVRDINKVGIIIDRAIESGANFSNGISFGVSDYEKYYNMALLKAVSKAKGKADIIASAIDVKLTVPVSIVELSNGNYPQPPVYYDRISMKESSNSSMSVETGTFKVKASVSMVYEY